MIGDIESMDVKVDDDVICVNDHKKRRIDSGKLKNITSGKMYKVLETKDFFYMVNGKKHKNVKFIKILGDKNKECWVASIRFFAQEEKVINYIREIRLGDIIKNDLVEI